MTSFDEMTAHWLCGQSFVAYDHNGLALYSGSFTFDLGGYFVLSCHRHDEEAVEGTGFDCVVSIDDLCRRRRDGFPIYQIFDDYTIARKVLLDARRT